MTAVRRAMPVPRAPAAAELSACRPARMADTGLLQRNSLPADRTRHGHSGSAKAQYSFLFKNV